MEDFDTFLGDYNERIAHGIANLDPAYSVTGYRGHNTRDGVAFTANLRLAGRIVATIEDSGTGGGPRVYCYTPEDRAAWENEVERVFPGDYLAGETAVESLLQRAGK